MKFVFIILILSFESHSLLAEQFGVDQPKNVPIVKLSEVLKTPLVFKERKISLVGNYGSRCCGTDFNYKEGLDGIEIHPNNFSGWENLRKGTPIQVYGTIKVISREGGEHIVRMTADGMVAK